LPVKFPKLLSGIHNKSYRFYRYFLSYVFPLIVILLLLKTVVYGNFITSLQSEVETSNIAVLTQIKNMIDIRMKEIENMAVNISTNNNLAPYKAMKSGIDAYEAIKELETYKSSNEFISDIAIYYNYMNNDRILTTTVDISIDRFFGYLYRFGNWSKEGFMEMIEDLKQPVIRPVETVDVNRYNKQEIAVYLHPFPLNVSKPYGYLLILIQKDAIEDIIRNVLKDRQGSICILDHEKKTLFHYSEGDIMFEPGNIGDIIGNDYAGESISTITLDERKYSVVQLPSEYNRWTYVTLMPSNQFMKKVNSTTVLFNLTTVLFLVLGLLAAYAFATDSYKPVKDLMGLISELQIHKNSNNSKIKRMDEFKIISRTLNDVSLENTGLRTKIRSKAGMLKEQLLWKLLSGKVANREDFQSMCDLTPISMKFPYFAVAVVMAENIQKLNDGNDQNSPDLIKFSIINVMEELAQDMGFGYGCEHTDERCVVVILNLKENYAKERCLSELAFKTKDIFKQHFDLSLTVGVGRIYSEIAMIHESFLEANNAIYYRMIKGCNNVIFYEDAKNSLSSDYSYPAEQESELVTAIKQGDGDEVVKVTNSLMNFMVEKKLAPEAVQCIYFGIINAVVKCMNEMGIQIRDLYVGNPDSPPFETLDELGSRMLDFCNKVCEIVEQQKENKNYEIRDRVLAIVRKRYFDNTLCVESIADELNMSASHLCRCFKEQAGTPLMQYIDSVRMHEAKLLLKNTRLPLKEIIEQTGYLNESSFIRKFRQKEGITPIQYRNISCSETLTS